MSFADDNNLILLPTWENPGKPMDQGRLLASSNAFRTTRYAILCFQYAERDAFILCSIHLARTLGPLSNYDLSLTQTLRITCTTSVHEPSSILSIDSYE